MTASRSRYPDPTHRHAQLAWPGLAPRVSPLAGLCLFLPIIYGLPVYAFTWLTGLGGFLNPYLFHASTRQYASPDLPTALAVFLLIDLTKGMAIQFALALGEEIGWRGLLVPEWPRRTASPKQL